MQKKLNIAIIACEPSGDILSADLINQLGSNISFFGITGPKMEQAGCEKIFSIDELSVMGIVEIIKHLPRLIRLRNKILKTILQRKPDLVIAVDAPDFNLGLEKKIKKYNKDIKVIHYVSPSIWAWRKNRIKTIKKSVDKVLCLFPFEKEIYNKHNVASSYVGHPILKKFTFKDHKQKTLARHNLDLNHEDIVIGLLPGSRRSEVEAIFPVIIEYINLYYYKIKNIKFEIALSNEKYRTFIENDILKLNNEIKINISSDSKNVMYASDVLLCASGTVTLEAAIIGTPMIVMYHLSSFTWLIAKLLVCSKYAALPNIILDKYVVPELLQKDLNPVKIDYHLDKILNEHNYRKEIINNLAEVKNSFNSKNKRSIYESIEEVVNL